MATAIDMPSMLTMSHQQNSMVDDSMDTYFDFNQGDFHSPVSQSADIKLSPNSGSLDSAASEQPSEYVEHPQRHYNGPSHEYGRFRQQTGLPSGALSHMAAVNGYNAPAHSDYSTGYNSGFDFDGASFAVEGSSSSQPMPAYFYAGDSSMDEYIDPSAVAAPQPPVMRLRPGIHSLQAQQAEQMRTQQTQQQQQQPQQKQQAPQQQLGMANQRPLPQMQEPHAEEPQLNSQISRLLSQMRSGSIGSSNADGSPEADGNEGIPAVGRSRKDDDDMDEDERLLASEEGKKLSSKERRQLRNKVSARAFRSRRKEYISQLEGEVNARTEEAASLRSRNNHLFAQNQQLLQLTQTMLAHPAFGTFMQELSQNPSMLQQAPQNNQQQQQQRTQQPARQEAAPARNDTIVGMTMIPEPSLDFSMLNLGANNNSYASSAQSFNNFQGPQIFAVHELPKGPSPADIAAERSARKSDLPLIPELPNLCEKEARPTAEIATPAKAAQPCQDDADSNDPLFALYVDTPVSRSSSSAPAKLDLSAISNKSTSTTKTDDTTLIKELEDLFAPVEETLRVIGRMI